MPHRRGYARRTADGLVGRPARPPGRGPECPDAGMNASYRGRPQPWRPGPVQGRGSRHDGHRPGHARRRRPWVTIAQVRDGDSLVPVAAGERISERQALVALLLSSADNMAWILARWDAGSEGAFVARMNSTASRLGMTSTRYTDPSGLARTTVSTAADQVRLGSPPAGGRAQGPDRRRQLRPARDDPDHAAGRAQGRSLAGAPAGMRRTPA